MYGWKQEEEREVLVREYTRNQWVTRTIVLSCEQNGKCLCYCDSQPEMPFSRWSYWKEIPKKVIKPFECLPFDWAGKAVRLKEWPTGEWVIVTGGGGKTVIISNDGAIPFVDFAKHWETVDGQPCGIEVEAEEDGTDEK